MPPAVFAAKFRSYVKQNSTTLTDAAILTIANPVKDEIAMQIAQKDYLGNYFIVPITETLLADQREYAWPDDLLSHLFSVEIAFDSDLDYILAKPDNFSRLELARTEDNIRANYDNQNPKYENQRRALYLLTGDIGSTVIGGATLANAIRLRYRAYPANLTDMTEASTDLSTDPSTTTFGMPRQFHELWVRRCSIEWKAAHPGAVPLSELEKRYDIDLNAALDSIANNDLGREIQGSIPAYESGFNL